MKISLLQRVLVSLAVMSLLATVAGCQSAVTPCDYPVTRFSDAMVWTAEGFERMDFEVSGEVFVRPGSCGAAQTEIDMSQRWLTPAFGDTHSHRLESGFMFPKFDQQFIREGIYYVMNPNADDRLMRVILEKSAQAGSVDVATTLGGITSTFGHPQGGLSLVVAQFLYPGQDRDAMEGHVFHSVDRAEDISPVLDTLVEQGSSAIKVYLHDSERFDKKRALVTPQAVADGLDYSQTDYLFGLNPDLLPGIVSGARKRGLRVMAHIHSLADLRLAVNAGVDHLAHLPGAYVNDKEQLAARRLTPDDASAIAERNISVTASYSARPDITPAELRDTLIELQAHNIRLLHEAGVTLYLGADRYDQTAAYEFAYWLENAFLPEHEVLACWIASGGFIFPQRKIGKLAPGYEADFLVFDRNPAEDGNALTRLQQRYKAGALLPVTEQPETAENQP